MAGLGSRTYIENGVVYADCGGCTKKDGCPIFGFFVYPKTMEFVENNGGDIEQAYEDALKLRADVGDTEPAAAYGIGGVVSYIDAISKQKDSLLFQKIAMPRNFTEFLALTTAFHKYIDPERVASALADSVKNDDEEE